MQGLIAAPPLTHLHPTGRPKVLMNSIERKEDHKVEKTLQRKINQPPEIRMNGNEGDFVMKDKLADRIKLPVDDDSKIPIRVTWRPASKDGSDFSQSNPGDFSPPLFSLSVGVCDNSPTRMVSRDTSDVSIEPISNFHTPTRSQALPRRSSRSSYLSESSSPSPSRRRVDTVSQLAFPPSSHGSAARRSSLQMNSAVMDEEEEDKWAAMKTPHRRSSSRSSRDELTARLNAFVAPTTPKELTSSPVSLLSPKLPSPRQHKRFNSEFQPQRDRVVDLHPRRARHESLSAGGRSSQSMDSHKESLILKTEERILAKYQLGNVCIGKGQFGAVYRALNQDTGQVVAVKRVNIEDKAEEDIKQLMREVELLQKLSHPSIVRYEGFIMADNYINIILEYVENGSLQHNLRAYGAIKENLVAKYTAMILEGLSYLHKQEVVHCDLKAANILTTKHGNVKLSDFGVSLQLKLVQEMKEDVQGTPYWMAPEIIQLEGASTASDIWSLGCTIIELLTGQPPYHELLSYTAMYRIVQDDCPPLPANITDSLRDFLCKCFRKNPKQRPSADDLFEHPWILANWNSKELRPQESVPFFRRYSASEGQSLERQTEVSMASGRSEFVAGNSKGNLGRPKTIDGHINAIPSSGSNSFFLPAFIMRKSIDEDGRPRSAPLLGRAMSSPPQLNATSSPALNNGMSSSIPHRFVKSTFQKSVECKLCHGLVKKHAVVCEECGLVAHASCARHALWPCCGRRQYTPSSTNASVDAPLPPESPNTIPYQHTSLSNISVTTPLSTSIGGHITDTNNIPIALSSSPITPSSVAFPSSLPTPSRTGKLMKRAKRDSMQANQPSEEPKARVNVGCSPPSTADDYSSSTHSSRGTLATAMSSGSTSTTVSGGGLPLTPTMPDGRRIKTTSFSGDHEYKAQKRSSKMRSRGEDCVIS